MAEDKQCWPTRLKSKSYAEEKMDETSGELMIHSLQTWKTRQQGLRFLPGFGLCERVLCLL